MKEHRAMKGLSTGPLSVSNTLDPPARFFVRNHPALPLPVSTAQTQIDSDFDEDARIVAVGFGPTGAKMAQLLSRNLPGISCHEVTSNPKSGSSGQMAALLSSIRESDLLLVMAAFDDEYCGEGARIIGHSAREAGVLSLALIDDDNDVSPKSIAKLADAFDTVFAVSDVSLADIQDPLLVRKDVLAGYSMRHMVTVITNLINQRSLVCVDFADIAMIMRKGSIGRLGVGVASGPARGSTAAKIALERLTTQGVSTFDATSVLAIAQGSSLFTMDDLNDVNRVMHDHVAEDVKMIVGFVTDDRLGNNVRVSVMPVR